METSIIEKIVSGTASSQEKADFKFWLQESESNLVYFEQIKVLWEKSNKIPEPAHFDKIVGKNKIRKKLHLRKIAAAKAKTRRIWISAAASIAILLGISSQIFIQKGIIFQNTIEYTALNSVKEVLLPDGSAVWINANSTLIVPEKFKKNKRKVKLYGEAYFEVARDEYRPFIIQTGKTTTKVLGTSFNIKMDENNGNVSVTVNSGRVAFYKKNNENGAVILHAGDMAEFLNAKQFIKQHTNNDLNYLAWKTGIITFHNTPLKEVCEVLEKYYKQAIGTTLSDPNYVINGIFENEKLDDLLSTIQLTLDVRIVKKTDQIIISK